MAVAAAGGSALGDAGLSLLPPLPLLGAPPGGGDPAAGTIPVEKTAASPGLVYRGAAQVQPSGASTDVTPVLTFLDGADNVLTWAEGQPTDAPTGASTALLPVVGLSPPGTAGVELTLLSSNPAATLSSQPTVGSATSPSPGPTGPLRTVGNEVVDATGAPVTFRGVNYTGLTDTATPKGFGQAEFARMRQWGFNLVRINLAEELYDAGSCQYQSAYPPAVAQAVQWVTSLGMVALLDLHRSAPIACSTPGQQQMADSAGSIPFWHSLATVYQGNPLVAFDLFNEPHGVSDAVWLDGGIAYDNFVPYAAAGMQQLYGTVRATGAQNLVMVTGNNWGGSVPANLVQGTNVVYSVHDYTCPQYPPPQCTTADPTDPSVIADRWLAVGSQFPVIVGEFGWPSAGDGTYNANVIAFAQARHWSWSAFSWSGPGSTFSLLATDPGTGPAEPDPSGMPVLSAATAGTQ